MARKSSRGLLIRRSQVARRYTDLVAIVCADQGGVDRMSEAKMQLARRFIDLKPSFVFSRINRAKHTCTFTKNCAGGRAQSANGIWIQNSLFDQRAMAAKVAQEMALASVTHAHFCHEAHSLISSRLRSRSATAPARWSRGEAPLGVPSCRADIGSPPVAGAFARKLHIPQSSALRRANVAKVDRLAAPCSTARDARRRQDQDHLGRYGGWWCA